MNVLPDEVLAHRLAMIPIPTSQEEGLVFPDQCENCKDVVEKDKGCPMCQSCTRCLLVVRLRMRRTLQNRVCF